MSGGNYVGQAPGPDATQFLLAALVGSIVWRNSAGTGLVIANGQTLLKASYPELWTYAQGFITTDQVVNPGLYLNVDASNFKVPNLAGLFLRAQGGASAALGVKQAFSTGKPNAVPALQTSHLTSGTAGTVAISYIGGAAILTSGWDAETRPDNVALIPCIFTGRLS